MPSFFFSDGKSLIRAIIEELLNCRESREEYIGLTNRWQNGCSRQVRIADILGNHYKEEMEQ